MPFRVDRFVLMSSKESVGGGPYIVEEEYPLVAGRGTLASGSFAARESGQIR